MRNFVCLSAVAVLSLLSQVQPADAGSRRNSAFDGFYVGGGGTWEQYNTEIEIFGVDVDDALGNPFDTSGIEGGRAFAGFGMQNGSLYGGLEAFASFTGSELVFPFDADVDFPGMFDPAMGGPSNVFIRANYSFGGSARVGLFMTPRAMIFAKGTATTTSFDVGLNGAILNGTAFQGSEIAVTDSLTAFGFGGGVEVAVMDNVFVRADYDQLWFSNAEFQIDVLSIEPHYRAVTVSAGYRF